jgi:signal transduction histidine kinase
MYEIADKLILFLCCITLYLFNADSNFFIVPVILTILLSSLFIYYEDRRIKLAGFLLFASLCLFFPVYIIFLPVLLYDILHTKYQAWLALVPFLYIYHLSEYTSIIISFTSVFIAAAYLLKYKTDRSNSLKNEYNDLRDTSAQMSILLEEKNQTLLKNQDYEINLATLNERNRISKEIHDSIGHLLSRSLLQVGAMLTVSRDEAVKEGLVSLKESLSDGMDQIRNHIHNMYDDSIDLFLQIEHLVKDFTFCPVTYDYDIKSQPSLQLKQCFIAITKESLTNIIRHSDATKVSILLREHPAIYQLIIQDNGTVRNPAKKVIENVLSNQEAAEGMGLRNIIDRVKSFEGNINITTEQGFKLFISVPKKTKH